MLKKSVFNRDPHNDEGVDFNNDKRSQPFYNRLQVKNDKEKVKRFSGAFSFW